MAALRFDQFSLAQRAGLMCLAVLLVIGAVVGAGIWLKVAALERQLPSVESLREPNLGAPLMVLSADGKRLGEFGAERRSPLRYEQFPDQLLKAFLAAEDDQFFSHDGVDYLGLIRAALSLAATGEKRQGGSTITMQLARNVFLTPERSYERKIKEILLARKMERELDKNTIFEIYLNRIFLGSRAYGVAAAAYVYFGKPLNALSLSEAAVLAGLPKAPSRDNPLANPARAKDRRNYVLRRMRDVGFIEESAYRAALAEPVVAREHPPQVEAEAHYVAEMVRAAMVEKYGEAAYTAGYRVVTTVESVKQEAANAALRKALLEYEERHGYAGPEQKATPELIATLGSTAPAQNAALQELLRGRPRLAGLPAAVIVAASPEQLQVYSLERGVEVIDAKGFAWTGKKYPLAVGDVVRVRQAGDKLRLSQKPEAQAAFVALDPRDGAIRALVGGYDFFAGKFNRVTQARRQAGSGFKPFLYAAALAKGRTPATIYLDAPIVFDDPNLETEWRPANYDEDFKGPMRLREALVQSRNLVSIRVLQDVGMGYALNYAQNFGLDKARLPRDLTFSLGSAALTPLEVARGYAVIANGGFLVDPYFIARIEDARGKVLFDAKPVRACPECPPEITAGDPAAQLAPRTVDPQSDFMIQSMLHDVAVRGTAAALNALGRRDLGGKTGTSNDETDAWFNGIQATLAATAWIGYDTPTPLGRGEVGGRAALPMWMDFMRVALKGVPEQPPVRPAGMTDVRLNPENGKLAWEGAAKVVYETLPLDRLPPQDDGLIPGFESEAGAAAQDIY